MDEQVNTADSTGASMIMGGRIRDAIQALAGTYRVECRDKDGDLRWEDTIDNLVTDVGARAMLNAALDNTAAGAVYMGLKGTGTAAVGDTMSSHATWSEVGGTNAPAYSSTRKTPSWSAAAGSSGAGNRSKATSAAASFTFTSGGTVAGCFLVIGGTTAQDNTTGTLFSAGDFSGGSRTVVSTDVINVTYTLSL
jgi:hypothetical protein